jgi:hypothetical protein
VVEQIEVILDLIEEVKEMVESGVCISNYSQGSTVEDNLTNLRKFLEDQEKLKRKKEWDLLAETALELSSPDSKNLEAAAGVPNVSTGGQSDEVATQTPGQKPETDTVATQKPEQESDSGGIESRINELIEGLENKDCLEGLRSIESFLNSNEFRRSSVSPEYIQLIANAILEIVNRGIQSEGIKLFNYFLMMKYPECFDILDKAIGMESTQTAEQLKKWLTELFIRIRDQVVRFDDLVAETKDTTSISSSLYDIIGEDNLYFLRLIYGRMTQGRSQVDKIIREVFAKPFNEWVEANKTRMNAIAGLEQVDENQITRDLQRLKQLRERNQHGLRLSQRESDEYDLIKNKYESLKEELSKAKSNLCHCYQAFFDSQGPVIDEMFEVYKNDILRRIQSILDMIW